MSEEATIENPPPGWERDKLELLIPHGILAALLLILLGVSFSQYHYSCKNKHRLQAEDEGRRYRAIMNHNVDEDGAVSRTRRCRPWMPMFLLTNQYRNHRHTLNSIDLSNSNADHSDGDYITAHQQHCPADVRQNVQQDSINNNDFHTASTPRSDPQKHSTEIVNVDVSRSCAEAGSSHLFSTRRQEVPRVKRSKSTKDKKHSHHLLKTSRSLNNVVAPLNCANDQVLSDVSTIKTAIRDTAIRTPMRERRTNSTPNTTPNTPPYVGRLEQLHITSRLGSIAQFDT